MCEETVDEDIAENIRVKTKLMKGLWKNLDLPIYKLLKVWYTIHGQTNTLPTNRRNTK